MGNDGEAGAQTGRAGVRPHTETHYSLLTKSLRRFSVLPGPNAFLSELIYFLIAFLYLAPKAMRHTVNLLGHSDSVGSLSTLFLMER